MSYDVDRLRADFPALEQEVNGKPLAYLDNAASTQKPRAVLDALDQIYARDYSNIHRGVHQLSVRATTSYEAARGSVKRFLGAARPLRIGWASCCSVYLHACCNCSPGAVEARGAFGVPVCKVHDGTVRNFK